MARTIVSRGHTLPQAAPGFDDIDRYWDPVAMKCAAKILPGEFYVTMNDEMIVTVLGSCVSACIRDPRIGVSGMNHFMLPDGDGAEGARYGLYAMEQLINEMLKLGAKKSRLEIKLTGGGRIRDFGADVGQWNIEFVKDFLKTEQLPTMVEDLGGNHPRKVQYHAQSGRMRVMKLETLHNDTLKQREQTYKQKLNKEGTSGGDVELF